jgi:hypothetical protein
MLNVPSSVVIVTSIASLLGFAINVLVMSVILLRRSKTHHLLFALILSVAAIWDLGILLAMIRNDFPDEIILYQNIISIPFNIFPALVYNFTTSYLNQQRKKSIIAIYVYCIPSFALSITGTIRTYSGVYNYSWGNIARWNPVYNPILDALTQYAPALYASWLLVYFFSLLVSCWLLFQALKTESSPLTRRHLRYILASFAVFSIAYVKVLLTYGVDVPFLLPLGILLVDSFGAIIGLAIVKDRLFDITVYVRIGIFYSLFTALIIFIFDFSQHLVASFLVGVVGEESVYAHYVSIAIVIIIFMPLKQRLEHVIEGVFAEKKIEF